MPNSPNSTTVLSTNKPLRVVDIVEGTSVDGPGLRTSVYFAGCEHHCPGCHNPTTWPHDAGHDMTIDEIVKVVDYNNFDVTFSGGDPMYQAEALLPLARKLKLDGRNIWCYTGFTFEELKAHPEMCRLLDYIDVLVDGPFIESRRNTGLLFCGSDNQRLIDVRRTKENGKISLWKREVTDKTTDKI